MELIPHRSNQDTGGDEVKKYVVIPGWVTSKNDYGEHYITAQQLISLYRVNPSDCHILNNDKFFEPQEGQIVLRPRYDGDYSLVKPNIGGVG